MAKLDHITESYENATAYTTEHTLFIIHAGTNDIKQTKSEALLAKYREMIRKYKVKSSNIIIYGILPRINAESNFHDEASSINWRLINLCREEGVDFINLLDQFYTVNHLPARWTSPQSCRLSKFCEAVIRSSVLLQVKKRESGRSTVNTVNTRTRNHINSRPHSSTINVIFRVLPLR